MRESHIWELSLAHEQHYHERRAHVADLLVQWGSVTNTKWPERARFIAVHDILLTPAWLPRIVEIGKLSISRTIPGWKLTELFPTKQWRQWAHDVYFVEARQGNVDKGPHAASLHAYVAADDYMRVISLVCDHTNATTRVISQAYTEYACPDCGYKWGVDTSD